MKLTLSKEEIIDICLTKAQEELGVSADKGSASILVTADEEFIAYENIELEFDIE